KKKICTKMALSLVYQGIQRSWSFFVMSHTGETYMSHPRALHKAVKLNQKTVSVDLEMIEEIKQYD
ncbi:TPA: hypothetical protein ACM9BQ_005350, partial [Escherichia coli O103:H2]